MFKYNVDVEQNGEMASFIVKDWQPLSVLKIDFTDDAQQLFWRENKEFLLVTMC